jgi:anaphase-promoting complex subunit 2
MEWHTAWSPVQESVPLLMDSVVGADGTVWDGFCFQVLSAFDHAFQTHLFSVLPASFPRGFKALIASTLKPYTDPASPPSSPTLSAPSTPARDLTLWTAFNTLGLLNWYESLISSVCYEAIEMHILGSCAGRWGEAVLGQLREWMGERVVPWMLLPYARGGGGGEEL